MAMRYTYNQETCRYEPIVVGSGQFAKKAFQFLGISLLLGAGLLLYYNSQYDLLDERVEKDKNEMLKSQWQVLHHQLEQMSTDLAKIEDTDDNNFRTILELEPLSQSIRDAGTGGHEKNGEQISNPIIKNSAILANKISDRITIEQQSMQELGEKLEQVQRERASRPAIQPISNHNLIRLNKIFGLRLHPIFHYIRPHNGLDLTAAYGTHVYASADGQVVYAEPASGYGNVIFVNHGYGFETRYAHLSRYNVKKGDYVKRGQLIGFVGSTGTSTNNHLHYEVIYNGKYINPISFLNTDLTQDEYNKLIKHNHDDKTARQKQAKSSQSK
ncbi:MAG: M23 family metallopeptidase [Bacteroidetes bacterium]|nr:M23 family metallopeptidase [Bacteroidota bacterium]MBS1539801.1 M23 family metallopeptidase [Bacteroidota bacterium]